jgi:4-amino-4-deoxy-L-arabinose transferase-like glycosyltransferase
MFSKKTPLTPYAIFASVFLLSFFTSTIILYIIGPFFNLAGNFGGQGHDGYIELARNLVRGDGYVFEPGGPPSLHRPPAFPFFLIPAALLPDSLQQLGVIILKSIFLGGVASLLYKFTKQYFNRRLALTTVAILVLNPWVLWSVKNPTVAIFQMFIVTAFIALVAHCFFPPDELKIKSSLGSGMALGLVGAILALTHGVMLHIVFTVFVFLFIAGWIKKQRKWREMTSLALIVLFLVVAPWTYRNWQVTGRFLPVVGNIGLVYFLGNSHWELGKLDADLDLPKNDSILFQERTRALLYAGIDRPQEEVLQFFGVRDPKLDAQLTQKAVHHALEHPGLFVKKILLNGLEYYFPAFYCLAPPDPIPMSRHSLWTRIIKDCGKSVLLESFYFVFLWILAVYGTVNAFTNSYKKPHFITLLGIIFLIAFPYFPFFTLIGHSLYTFSTLPFLSILSASGILCLWNRFFEKSRSQLS